MNTIIELLGKFLAAFNVLIAGLLNQIAGYVPNRMPQVLSTTISFTSTSQELSGSIELPENANGWVVLAMTFIATTNDFTVAVRRSVGSRSLTPSKVYSQLVLSDVDTAEQSRVPPFDAASKETFTFEGKNGATATNTVRIAMVVREK
jgi:hypothetical protein